MIFLHTCVHYLLCCNTLFNITLLYCEQLGATDVDTIGHVLGNKPESAVKVPAKLQQQEAEDSTNDEPKVKKKAVEAFELPGILPETSKPKVLLLF